MISPSQQTLASAKNALGVALGMDLSSLGATVVPRGEILNYKLIPAHALTGDAKRLAYKVNSLIDLYYFAKVILHKTRFQVGRQSLHYQMCLSVMKDGLKEVIEIPRDHYKALDLNTLIPTPVGFKKLEDIHVGDFVFSSSGEPTEVIGESEVKNSNKCYVVTFSTGDKILCDAGHLWEVDDRKRQLNELLYHGPYVYTTEELASSYIMNERVDVNTKVIHYEHRYKIVAAKAVQYEEKNLIIHPYALGCWLGDGTSAGASFTCADPDIISVLKEVGIKITIQAAKYRYGFVDNFCQKINKLGVTNDKHIPEVYLLGSEEQRWDLLCGLMDTDGSISKEGQCSFTNTNLELMQQIRILMASLGLKPSSISQYDAYVGKKESAEYKKKAFVITFYPNQRIPFYLPRKQDRCRDRKRGEYRQIVKIDSFPSVPVKCISVKAKDKLFLVGESFIPTHNSTVYSECFPVWRALPFGKLEEDIFSSLGYSDLFIEWMRRTHSQDIRILLISETIKNAIKLGVRISNQYTNNSDFRETFPELIPGTQETWTNDSLHQRRTNLGKGQGEGTFDFIGVGAALQSRHYDLVIEDDLVGKEALNSEITMQSTIEYHQLLVGAMDSPVGNPNRDFDEIIVGNRWSHKDLNSWVRENEPNFNFTTHSALGGCCALHPLGQPIFPESFGINKLLTYKRRLGSYFFSCQFLNFPIDPSKAKFKMSDFRYFHYEQVGGAIANPKGLGLGQTPNQKRTVIRHHVVEGDVLKDVFPRHLDRFLVIDPNHAGHHQHDKVGTGGRCRHAAIVSGVQRDPRRVYLLEMWAEDCSIDNFVVKMFDLAVKWKLDKIYVEGVGAQKYLIYHLRYFISENKHTKPEITHIQIVELKTPNNANAKTERIDSTIPLVERNEVWLADGTYRDRDGQIKDYGLSKFRDEAEAWGQKKGLIDLLDVFGYGLQVWNFDLVDQDEIAEFLGKRLARWKRGMEAVA